MRVYVHNCWRKTKQQWWWWHRLSHLNTRYEPYNEQYINHRHRAYCCINYVLIFAFFTIILLPRTVRWSVYFMINRAEKLKQAKPGQFSIFLIRNRTIFCLKINHIIDLYRCIVWIYQAIVLRKSVCVLKYCLVKHGLNCSL